MAAMAVAAAAFTVARCRAHAAFAGMDMLMKVKAEDADVADGAARFSILAAEWVLGIIFNEEKVIIIGDLS